MLCRVVVGSEKAGKGMYRSKGGGEGRWWWGRQGSEKEDKAGRVKHVQEGYTP